MIKTVIFDLGGVIVPLDFARGYAAMARHCGYSVEEMPKRIGGTDIVRRYESGEMTSEEFVRDMASLLGFSLSYDDFCEVWSSIFLSRTLVPESLMEELKSKGARLVLLSNTNDIHFRMIRDNYPILRFFDQFVLSYEVGAMKPSPAIYEAAIRAAGARPDECFFTDDVLTYVEGARRAGIDAVQFESYEQIRSELSSRGF